MRGWGQRCRAPAPRRKLPAPLGFHGAARARGPAAQPLSPCAPGGPSLPLAPLAAPQEMPMGVIRLRDITVFPRLGVGELEKEWVQKVTLDVEMTLDLAPAAESDEIRDTVDYQRVYELVREISARRKYHLVEALAHRIAVEILTRFQIAHVLVRVRKSNLPFDAHLNCVEVEIEEPAR
ncbi:MAG: dihydroneopterin aldolase [Candidatus Eisenbacteria bacterium]|nr:dihydroneopterin aldolase [Candidatus Eisenbacteria bacterium]